MNTPSPEFNRAVIEEIRSELGERFDYCQWVNGNGLLWASVLDRKTKLSCSGTSVHYGTNPKVHALDMRDQLLSREQDGKQDRASV